MGTQKSFGATTSPPDLRNKLINPDFDFAQRSPETVVSDVANEEYVLDRFVVGKVISGTAVVDMSQSSASVPTTLQSGHTSTYSLLADTTTLQSSIAAGEYFIVSQRVEGNNFRPLFEQPFVLSFWANHSPGGTYTVGFRNGTGDLHYVAEYTVAIDVWTKIEIPVPASSGGTWVLDEGVGLSVDWVVAAGTDWHTTPNVWTSGNKFSTSNQVNGLEFGNASFRLSQVQLESGDKATPFQTRLFGDELDLCQRYYFKTFNQAIAQGQGTGSFSGAVYAVSHSNVVRQMLRYPVPMRIAPTVTSYNPSSSVSNTSWRNKGDTVDAAFGSDAAGDSAIGLESVAGVDADAYLVHITADAEL